jgi:hypothetical protein
MTQCEKCDKPARFGIKDEPKRCYNHKISNMVSLNVVKCKYCNKKAVYGSDGIMITCAEHRLITYHRAKNSILCVCGVSASFGLLSDRIRRTCSKHKLPGYQSLTNMKCHCGKRGTYKASVIFKTRVPTTYYCKLHKTSDSLKVSTKCWCGKFAHTKIDKYSGVCNTHILHKSLSYMITIDNLI